MVILTSQSSKFAMVTLTFSILKTFFDLSCPEVRIPHTLLFNNTYLFNQAQGSFNAYYELVGDWVFTYKGSKCARNPDRSLKDAKDIIFYNDPDDAVPISTPSSSAQPPTDTFSVLLQTGHKPVPLTAGAQCSICTSKPSACLHNSDNACSSTSHKHALSSATEQLVRKKVVLQLSTPLSDDNMDIDTDHGAGQSDEAEDEDVPAPEDKPEDKLEDLQDTTIQAALSKRMLVNLKASTHFAEVSLHYAHTFVSHFQLYKSCCKAANITMHPQVVPTGEVQSLSRQSTLDGSLAPKVPMFTKAGLLEYIMELIVTEDEALQLIDKPAFCNLLCYICPAIAESDMPHRTKLMETVKAHAVQVVNIIHECLAKVDSQVLMTFNSWTSIIGDPFFSITGHYIWSPDDKPQQWELHREQLSFAHIQGNHSGQNMARLIVDTIDKYEL
ncbi:hypothetical protein BDR06DRAFT_1014256 [Suillus hirtellus]|nr:hypothetical protein BDR06DRAFT_1014256 [Suillus hirtellus]